MTDNQIHAFNKELCELMRRYNLKGLVGVTFDEKMESGLIDLHTGLSPVKEAVGFIAGKLTQWSNEIDPTPPQREIRGVDYGKRGN